MKDPIIWNSAPDGIVELVLDDPDAPVNTFTVQFAASLEATVTRLERERDSLRGVIITSAKETFLAGGDLNRLLAVGPADASGFATDLDVRKARLTRLENLGLPVVAVLNGSALGGGLELALACHHRIAVASPTTVFGLPEVGLGLLPGAGGIVRAVRLLGRRVAVDDVIAPSRRFTPEEAGTIGLVDSVVPSLSKALADARAFILGHPATPLVAAMASDSLDPAPFLDCPPVADPALLFVERVAAIADAGDEATAFAVETQALARLVAAPTSKHTIAVNFFDLRAARRRLRALAATSPVTLSLRSDEGLLIETARDHLPAHLLEAGDTVVDLELTDAPVLGPGQARILPDRTGDGVVLLQFAVSEDGDRNAALFSLYREGVLPYAVQPGMPAIDAVLRTALRQAWHDQVSAGVPVTRLAGAVAWAGLDPALCEIGGDLAYVDDDAAQVAGQVLDAVAHRAVGPRRWSGLVDPEGLDLVSVRLGIFPAWTGGAARWAAGRGDAENVVA